MKTEKLLQELLADLMKINVNIHNLHWNVTGMGFEEYHELTEEFYNDVFEKYDDVAEILKTNGLFPVASLAAYDKASGIKDIEPKDFSDEEVLKEVKAIYDYLKAKFIEIREVAVEADEFGVANVMEGYIGDYSKKLWMINARLK